MEEYYTRAQRLDLSKVFVVGGQPEYTYVARDSQLIEEAFKRYLADGHKFLSLTGSTKTGKSVLLHRLMSSNAVVVNGGAIRSEQDFFDSLRVSLARGANLQFTAGPAVDILTANKFLILDVLQRSQLTLVIEDFHFVAANLRKEIAHVLKEPVRAGLRVVLVSVPHRGFDAVRAENELNQRVQVLEVPSWTDAELAQIAKKGFAALNVSLSDKETSDLATNCYGSPQLMQAICRELCVLNGISATVPGTRTVLKLTNKKQLFETVAANELSPADLEVLLQARGQRSKRTYYRAKDGVDYDIYSLALRSIAELLPSSRLKAEAIWSRAQSFVKKPNSLYANQITSALNRMSEAAKQLPGERVLEWDELTSTVHIVDPGLAFLIKWGDWTKN